ncbi:MAG: hypothetical protein VB857_10550 [Pirellulaceae bacterium]
MSSRKRKIWIFLVALLLGLGLFLVYRAAKHVPEFYRQAIVSSPKQQQQFSEEFKKQLADLQSDVEKNQRFETILSEDQINGWLATTVAQQHAHRLPKGMREPRVAIQDGEVRVGCHFRRGKLDSVVWLIADLNLTEENNTLEIRLRGLKAGLIPFSIERFQEQVTASLRRAKLKFHWVAGAEELTARIQLPERFEGLAGKAVHFEKIELRAGRLLFSGRTTK